jgi:hypothetical protein
MFEHLFLLFPRTCVILFSSHNGRRVGAQHVAPAFLFLIGAFNFALVFMHHSLRMDETVRRDRNDSVRVGAVLEPPVFAFTFYSSLVTRHSSLLLRAGTSMTAKLLNRFAAAAATPPSLRLFSDVAMGIVSFSVAPCQRCCLFTRTSSLVPFTTTTTTRGDDIRCHQPSPFSPTSAQRMST